MGGGVGSTTRIIISMRGHVLQLPLPPFPLPTPLPSSFVSSSAKVKRVGFARFLKGTFAKRGGSGHKNKNCCAEWKVRLAI